MIYITQLRAVDMNRYPNETIKALKAAGLPIEAFNETVGNEDTGVKEDRVTFKTKSPITENDRQAFVSIIVGLGFWFGEFPERVLVMTL